jgi:hypothetical protein
MHFTLDGFFEIIFIYSTIHPEPMANIWPKKIWKNRKIYKSKKQQETSKKKIKHRLEIKYQIRKMGERLHSEKLLKAFCFNFKIIILDFRL